MPNLFVFHDLVRRHLKIIPFPVDWPGEIILRTYPAAFFKNKKSLIFQSFFSRFLNSSQRFIQNFSGITLEKNIFREKKVISQPPGWSFLVSPSGQKTDFFFSVA